MLVSKTLVPTAPPIAWGRHYEAIAIQKYISHMHDVGHNVSVKACGFLIHPTEGWLSASPDGRVSDEHFMQPSGIVEIKCPYSKREVHQKQHAVILFSVAS